MSMLLLTHLAKPDNHMAHIDANDQSFKSEVLDVKETPVLVDFWATWCYPCRVQGPIIEEVAAEAGDKMKVVKVDVDMSPAVAMQYNILSIPTLAIFKNGQMVWQGVGVHQKAALVEELKKHAA